MRKFQRIFAVMAVIALLGSTASLRAEDGDCYQEACYRKIRPEWALGGLAVVAVVAVCLQNSNAGHSH